MNEYILCAAIWYRFIPVKKEIPSSVVLPVNCDQGLVFCGYRHNHCMYTMVAVTGIRSVESEVGTYIQGFLTSKNRFVDREEAAKIHMANGHEVEFENRLFSEDLY